MKQDKRKEIIEEVNQALKRIRRKWANTKILLFGDLNINKIYTIEIFEQFSKLNSWKSTKQQ